MSPDSGQASHGSGDGTYTCLEAQHPPVAFCSSRIQLDVHVAPPPALCPCISHAPSSQYAGAVRLLVVLGRLHVPLLDVPPLALPVALAHAFYVSSNIRTPRLSVFQILSDPVSKALLRYFSAVSLCPFSCGMTYSCIPKAAPKTVKSIVVLLRRTALRVRVSTGAVGARVPCEEGRTCRRCRASTRVCQQRRTSRGQLTYASHFGGTRWGCPGVQCVESAGGGVEGVRLSGRIGAGEMREC